MFLPPSARGFTHEFNTPTILDDKHFFLGANHAISRAAIDFFGKNKNVYSDVGASGEGGAVGEETRMQKVLNNNGFKGVYVPKALVHHFVPKNACSLAWVKNRRYRHGLERAQNLNMRQEKNFFRVPKWVWKELLVTIIRVFVNKMRTNRMLSLNYWEIRGIIDGLHNRDRNISGR